MKINTIEDIITLDDQIIEKINNQLSDEELAIALKAVSPATTSKFTENMSKERKEKVTKRREELGPVKMELVKEIHSKIIQLI